MKKKTIIIVAIVLVVAALVILLAYLFPRNRRYDEEEVMAAASELITAATELNEIYYGKGISFLENSSHNISIYREADPMSLEKYGIKTVSQLKQKTLEVFADSHAESMFESAFSGTFAQNGTSNMSRYYQKYDDKGVNPICIMVRSDYEPLMNSENIYDMSSLKVEGSKREYVYVTIDVTVISGDNIQEQTLKIRLIEEEDGWRVSSTTFANYNELQDIYDELQKS